MRAKKLSKRNCTVVSQANVIKGATATLRESFAPLQGKQAYAAKQLEKRKRAEALSNGVASASSNGHSNGYANGVSKKVQ